MNPPVEGAPRGAHSKRPRQELSDLDVGPRHLRRAAPGEPKRRIRPGALFGASAAVAVIVGLVIALTPGSAPPPRNPARALSTTSMPAILNTISPTTVSTTPTTTSLAPTPTSTSLAPTSTSTSLAPTSTSLAPSNATVAVTASVPPSDILVEVLNGVGTPHVAVRAARALKQVGFLINGTGNAGAFDYSINVIEYGPGSLASAETVARYVSGASRFRRMSSLQKNEVWVTLGATYDGVI